MHHCAAHPATKQHPPYGDSRILMLVETAFAVTLIATQNLVCCLLDLCRLFTTPIFQGSGLS
jgi:hypothetical protein